MSDKKKPCRSNAEEHHQGALRRQPLPDFQVKDYNYALRLLPEDHAILDKYRETLALGCAGFAESFYDHVYENPDIAGAFYSYERDGGDAGLLVRSELKNMLSCIVDSEKIKQESELIAAGNDLLEHGFSPVLMITAYYRLIAFIRKFLSGLDVSTSDKNSLELITTKLLLRNMGLSMEGFWRAAHNNVNNKLQHVTNELDVAESLLNGIPHYLWTVDIKCNNVAYASHPLHALYTGELEAPFPFFSDTAVNDQQQLLTAWQTAVSGRFSHAEFRMSLADSGQHWYRVSLFPASNRRGRPAIIHCILEDINHLISERKQLEKLTTTDRLTQLPNRALWVNHLKLALAASRRVPGSHVVVISLDINQFKMYNDTLGRDVGDILLHDVADRLDSIVRESDSLARLGGDQFGILLQPVDSVRTATDRVITQILDTFDVPFTSQGRQLCISLTMGISCFPDHGTNEESLLSNAESAMQRAKRNGLPYQYFDPTNDVSTVEQLRYSGQIRSALDNNEFTLHYQPQVNIKTLRITGAEALLRWHHPVDGIVMPQRIIPVAEQLGMITPITNWVLVTALQQCRQWSFEGIQIPVSVNVSARSFQNPRLLEKIQWALQESGVDGDCLEIEITEATLMQDLDRATDVLSRLSDFGVTIAIDDFGTGYSSLSYLKRLPIHTLKIDQSFIIDVAFDQQDVAIVRSIIDLGHNLGYKVVAEGVENAVAWDMLNKLGCDTAQGFHISKPLNDNHFSSWLAESEHSIEGG